MASSHRFRPLIDEDDPDRAGSGSGKREDSAHPVVPRFFPDIYFIQNRTKEAQRLTLRLTRLPPCTLPFSLTHLPPYNLWSSLPKDIQELRRITESMRRYDICIRSFGLLMIDLHCSRSRIVQMAGDHKAAAEQFRDAARSLREIAGDLHSRVSDLHSRVGDLHSWEGDLRGLARDLRFAVEDLRVLRRVEEDIRSTAEDLDSTAEDLNSTAEYLVPTAVDKMKAGEPIPDFPPGFRHLLVTENPDPAVRRLSRRQAVDSASVVSSTKHSRSMSSPDVFPMPSPDEFHVPIKRTLTGWLPLQAYDNLETEKTIHPLTKDLEEAKKTINTLTKGLEEAKMTIDPTMSNEEEKYLLSKESDLEDAGGDARGDEDTDDDDDAYFPQPNIENLTYAYDWVDSSDDEEEKPLKEPPVCEVCLKDKAHWSGLCPFLVSIPNPRDTTLGKNWIIVCNCCGDGGDQDPHPGFEWEGRAIRDPVDVFY